jgi:hypothetical protein
MRTKTKANRVIDIALSEEKAYFPGETIAGKEKLFLKLT